MRVCEVTHESVRSSTKASEMESLMEEVMAWRGECVRRDDVEER